jgi:hypothetical protein
MKKNLLTIISLVLLALTAAAQAPAGEKPKTATKLDTTKIAQGPNKSGLSYDALTKFFQGSITSGKNGGFSFKATLYGFETLFSKDPNFGLSQNYLQHGGARNLEFQFGMNKDTTGNLNSIVGGVKYAWINKRDLSTFSFADIAPLNAAFARVGRLGSLAQGVYIQKNIDPLVAQIHAIDSILAKENAGYLVASDDAAKEQILNRKDSLSKTRATLLAQKKQAESTFEAFLAKYNADSAHSIAKDYPAEYQAILDSISKKMFHDSTAVEVYSLPVTLYKKEVQKINQGTLFTTTFNPGYNYSGRRMDSLSLTLELLQGLGNLEKPWDLDIQTRYTFRWDSLGGPCNLEKGVWSSTIGFNKTFIKDSKSNPILEFEIAGEDDLITQKKLPKDQWNTITANAVLRVHLTNQLTLPLTLKFDLKHPNIFSFLSLSWNLDNSSSSSSSSTSTSKSKS